MTTPSYDYLIVGAGLFGAVCARELTDAGKKVLVIERREHIAGNCYTQNMAGINVHMYGPHIFHTSNEAVWKYVNRFASFNNFVYRPMVRYHGKLYSFPINLLTMYQLYGVQSPEAAKRKLEEVRVKNPSPKNMEEFALNAVGEEIYEIFIKGYTTKQWGRTPDKLPADIFKRLVVRTNFDTNYYRDTHQGIPIGGYTKMIGNMLQGVEVLLGVDYFKARERWDATASKVIYTGPIDRYFRFVHGELEYINMRFDHEEVNTPDFQGVAAINHTEVEIPYTRIVEHKHFEFADTPTTVITHEYSLGVSSGLDKYYPIGDKKNLTTLEQYKSLAAQRKNVIFGGRLAEYKYYDMHQVISNALDVVKKELS